MTLDSKALLESLKRVNLFADKNKVVRLIMKDSLLTMSSFIPGQKSGEEILELLHPVSSEIQVSYNGSLMMAVLSALQGQKVTLSWESINRPVRVDGEHQKNIDVLYLLVPTRY